MEEDNNKIIITSKKEANSLGKRLKFIRKYFGKSQTEFAKDLGIGQSTYSNMEKERNPATVDIVKKLGDMGFSIEWVLYGDKAQEEQNISCKKVYKNIDTNLAIERITKLLSNLSSKDVNVCKEIIAVYVKSLQVKQ